MRKTNQDNVTASRTGVGARRGTSAILVAVLVAVGAVATAAGTPAFITLAQPDSPEMAPVVFKHWKHQRAHKCYTCHPGVFSESEKAVFDHDDMDAGKYCGACHDGKTAFVPSDAECEVCHVE